MDAKTTIQNADVEQYYREYWPMVLRRCRFLLGDADNAADAAQEVFVKILEKRNLLTVKHPLSFLWIMATNQCLNKLRSRVRCPEEANNSILEQIAGLSDIEAQTGRRDLLRKLFDRHPESNRTIAVLHFVDGMTIEDTAQTVGMSVDSVRYRLQTLRQTLKKLEGRREAPGL